jgi:hypothetical protein
MEEDKCFFEASSSFKKIPEGATNASFRNPKIKRR